MNALSIKNLKKTYGKSIEALKGIDIQVKQGDFFALLGPNGAGKSTTIGIITSLVTKSGGSVEAFGHNLDTETAAAKACIGLVPQEFNFSIFQTPLQILVHQAGYYGVPYATAQQRAEKYLKQLDLWSKRNEISRNLSGGMKRRLMIARALVHEPKLLILDEPTAGVDIEIRRSMWQFLRDINESGTTVILTTHYLEEAESLCRNIAIIDHGRIIEHSTMKALLGKLQIETFVLYLENPTQSAPLLNGFNCRLVEDTTLEVDIAKEQALNTVFAMLAEQNINVLSMRNKANRLEELFLNLIQREPSHAAK